MNYFVFLSHMTRQDLTDRYAGSVMGPLWALFLPMVQVAIFIVVFGTLMGGRLPGSSSTTDYGIYLIAGILPWNAFATTLLRMTTVFMDKKLILSKVGLPLMVAAAPVALAEGVTLVIGLTLLTLFAAASGRASAALLVVPLVIALQQLLAFALGCVLAAFTVFLRDISHMAGIVLQLWFWLTPIVYVPDILPAWAQPIARHNPAMIFVGPYHDVFLAGTVNSASILSLAGAALLACLLAWRLVHRLERDIRDTI